MAAPIAPATLADIMADPAAAGLIDEQLADTLQRMADGITERDRKLAELQAAAPLRSKGRAVEDVAHLPLFVAANEPPLF
jgi:hypothetical protein